MNYDFDRPATRQKIIDGGYDPYKKVIDCRNPRACNRCKEVKPVEGFARRRTTGQGNFRGENARRGICKACEKKAYPQKPWIERKKTNAN